MIADLATCEWSPGSNRSVVDPVVAVARLDMPAPTRARLIEKISKNQFDDVVSIRWATITSNDGNAQYLGTIYNMNFAEGRLCRSVTRKKWSAERVEGAIVFTIGDRSFGYAAPCGNLFELTRVPGGAVGPEAVAAPYLGDDSAVGPETMPLLPTEPAGAPDAAPLAAMDHEASPSFGSFAPVMTPGIGGVLVETCTCCGTSVVPVPEPGIWAIFLAGLAMLARRVYIIKKKD